MGSEYTMSQKYARFPKVWWSKSVRKFSQYFSKKNDASFPRITGKITFEGTSSLYVLWNIGPDYSRIFQHISFIKQIKSDRRLKN
jgi:hypothetical protein